MTKTIGRPSLYKVEYCEMAEDYLAGYHTMVSLGALFGVSERTVYEWVERHPQFSQAVQKGRARRARMLEDRLAEVIEQEPVNTAVLLFLAKNWLGMKDENSVRYEHTGKVEHVHSEAKEIVSSRIDQLATKRQAKAKTA